MERRRKMDLARLARFRRTLICTGITLICSAVYAAGQSNRDQEAKDLATAEKWQEVVSLAKSTSTRSPELNYWYGTALARLERWREAHQALQAGEKLSPRDERFPIELAGVDFKQKRYAETAMH